MRWAPLVAALLLACVAAREHRIASIEELVDLSETPYNRVRIVLRGLGPELASSFARPGVLDAVCDQLSPAYTRTCDFNRYVDRVELDLVTVKEQIRVSGGFSPATMRPTLSVYYVPLSFLVAGENEDVGSRVVRFELPTMGVAVTELARKRDVRLEFPLQCPDGGDGCWQRAALPTPASEYAVGDVVTADVGEAELAVWALFDEAGAARSEVRVCLNCTHIALPLSYKELGCPAYDHRMCPRQRMTLAALVRRRGSPTLVNATRAITVRPAFFPVEVFLSKGGGRGDDSFFRGEALLVSTGAFTSIERCEVEFLHEGAVVHRIAAPSCLMVPVVAGTSWPVGRYLVRAAVHNRHGFVGYGTAEMFLLSSGNDIPVPVTVDKPSYLAGEPVGLFINARGERCEVELVNYTGLDVNTVVRRTFPCGSLRFDLPESVMPGIYHLIVKVFRADEHGVHLAEVTVEPWRPRGERGSDLERLCHEGLLSSPGLEVPCIGPGVACRPRSDQHPVCLCFSSGGAALDACGFGERCGEVGCAYAQGPPFAVVERDGERVAQMGLARIPFVTTWEICPVHCVCSDESLSAVHDCHAGELCTPSGCYVPQLSAKLASLEPDHVRQDAIALGEARLVMEFSARFRSRALVEGLEAGDLSLSVGGSEVPSRALELRRSAGQWRLEAALPRSLAEELEPGPHPVSLLVRHEGQVAAVAGSLSVWYPTHGSDFRTKLTSVEPDAVARDEALAGAYVRLFLSVLDERERAVSDLARSDVRLSLDEGEVSLLSLSYAPSLRQWVASALVRGELAEGRRTLTVEVNRLGRRGASNAFLTVTGALKTTIDIEATDPGSKDEPVYQLLQRQGFDLDAMVTVRGEDVMSQSAVTGSVLGEDGRPIIDLGAPLYVAPTQLGYRLHFSGGRLCEPREGVEGWRRLRLVFAVQGASPRTVVAERAILFAPNPSGWSWDGPCA